MPDKRVIPILAAFLFGILFGVGHVLHDRGYVGPEEWRLAKQVERTYLEHKEKIRIQYEAAEILAAEQKIPFREAVILVQRHGRR